MGMYRRRKLHRYFFQTKLPGLSPGLKRNFLSHPVVSNPGSRSLPAVYIVMISVTEKAKDKIIELREKDGFNDSHKIRVAVKGGGCSGLMYDLLFDSEIKTQDDVFEDKGIQILVDKKSLLYLLGTTLDFSDGLNGKGFQFINPNASRTCGCGESFAV
jgi:iron-sulfur cluster assembly protein